MATYLGYQIFPQVPGLPFPFTRTPVWKTNTQDPISGKSTFVPLWNFGKYKWELPISLLRNNVTFAGQFDEFSTMLGFFNLVMGRGQPFHYLDADDNSVTQDSFAVSDGTTTTIYPFTRSKGGYVEPIQDVNSTGLILYDLTASSIINPATYGQILTPDYGTLYGVQFSGSSPPAGHSLGWSGSYYWFCAMDKDECPFVKFDSQRYEVKQFGFTSLKQ